MLPLKIIIALITGVGLLLTYILVCCRNRNVLGVEVKSLVSVCYIVIAALSLLEKPENCKFGLLIMVGGVMGLLGDVYLDQKWIHLNHKDKYLILGFLNFGIGHLFYISASVINAHLGFKDMIIPVIIALGVAVFNEILARFLDQDYGKFRWIVFAYGFVLALMMATAGSAYFKTDNISFLVFAVGGALFLLSDVVLSAIYFTRGGRKVTVGRFVINIVTYYMAQYLIALTPYYIEL